MDHVTHLEDIHARELELHEERVQRIVYREWLKQRELAASFSEGTAFRRAHQTIADSLQHLLEDWSTYGKSLVWHST
jgi:argininosuccinate lyase